MPTRLQVSAGGRTRVVDLDEEGRAELPGWRTDRFTVRVLATDPAFSVVGRQFVEAPAGISALRVDGRSLNPNAVRARSFGCGSGPLIRVGDQLVRTRLRASTKALVRGESVPFSACGRAEVDLDGTTTDVLATSVPALPRRLAAAAPDRCRRHRAHADGAGGDGTGGARRSRSPCRTGRATRC